MLIILLLIHELASLVGLGVSGHEEVVKDRAYANTLRDPYFDVTGAGESEVVSTAGCLPY